MSEGNNSWAPGFYMLYEKELSDDRESNCNGDVSMKQTPKQQLHLPLTQHQFSVFYSVMSSLISYEFLCSVLPYFQFSSPQYVYTNKSI